MSDAITSLTLDQWQRVVLPVILANREHELAKISVPGKPAPTEFEAIPILCEDGCGSVLGWKTLPVPWPAGRPRPPMDGFLCDECSLMRARRENQFFPLAGK